MTYNNLYMEIRAELKAAGVDMATLEARELTCFATGKSREELVRDGALYASPDLERRARELLARRLAGEPVAYLVGEWEFFGLGLDVSPAVLIPRTDTEALAAQAIEFCKTLAECRVLDLCAGSGCVGLAIGNRVLQARVVLGEVSEEALKICRQNVRRCGLSGRAACIQTDARKKPSPPWGSFNASCPTPLTSPPGTSPGWTPRCGITSPIWPWTAETTGWTSTATSRRSGAKR